MTTADLPAYLGRGSGGTRGTAAQSYAVPLGVDGNPAGDGSGDGNADGMAGGGVMFSDDDGSLLLPLMAKPMMTVTARHPAATPAPMRIFRLLIRAKRAVGW